MTTQTPIQTLLAALPNYTQNIVRQAVADAICERTVLHVPTGQTGRIVAISLASEQVTMQFSDDLLDASAVLIRDVADVA